MVWLKRRFSFDLRINWKSKNHMKSPNSGLWCAASRASALQRMFEAVAEIGGIRN